LSQDEVTALFGHGMPASTANRLMSIIHGRRVAGTLADPQFFPSTSNYDEQIKATALAWLRKNVPVDEKRSAGLRAEEELKAMEAELLADSERVGLYKPNPGEMQTTGGKKSKENSVYGQSGLDAIRRIKEEQYAAKQRAKAQGKTNQADEIRSNTRTLANVDGASRTVELRTPGEHPWLKHYKERAKVLPDVPPEMSIWERLWPSGFVVLMTVGASIGLSTFYEPPAHSARLWPDVPPAAATVIALVLANSVVLVAWRMPPAWRVLNKYFLNVPGYPRALSVVGNVFSHQTVPHFLSNMVMLWFVGTRLHDDLGRADFLAMFMSTGVCASFASLAYFVVTKNFITSGLGASGAIAGIVGSYLWLHKDEKFKFFGLPPSPYEGLPAIALLSVILSWELYGIVGKRMKTTNIDYWAHMGGYVSGIAGAEIFRRRRMEQRRLELERRKNRGLMEKLTDWS